MLRPALTNWTSCSADSVQGRSSSSRGRTSMGKSTFALSCVRHVAVEREVPVLMVSTEMGRHEITHNLIASMAEVNSKRLHDPRLLHPEDERAIDKAAARLARAPLHLFDGSPIDVPTIRSHARRQRLRGGLGLVVVDYLQQVQSSGLRAINRGTSREQEVSAISRAMKSLARELEVPVIVVSQLNRSADSREDHRPRLSDLRESGAIENDADVVLLLYRPDYYARNESQRVATRGSAEIDVAKQRNGPVGTVHASFQAEYARFANRSSTAGGAFSS